MNPHYHVLASVEIALVAWIALIGPKAWKDISRRGQLDFQEVHGPEGAYNYWAKRLVSDRTFGDVWIYKDTRACAVEESSVQVGKDS